MSLKITAFFLLLTLSLMIGKSESFYLSGKTGVGKFFGPRAVLEIF